MSVAAPERRARGALAAAAVCVVGCGGKTDPASAPQVSRGPTRADTLRAERLAQARDAGLRQMRVDFKASSTLRAPIEAVREGQDGSVILAFVVKPDGRVDRDTRTIVQIDGHPIYAKNVCDFLLGAKFTNPPTDPRGAIGIFPISFTVAPGVQSVARERHAQIAEAFQKRVHQMTADEAWDWFLARPNCSAIKIGLDPLYKPPG